MDIETAKTISFTAFLETLGHLPERKGAGSDELWYLSPLRSERTPSFKLKSDRLWYDHGIGEGGTLIDFALKYRRTDSIKEVLQWLAHYDHLSRQVARIDSKRQPAIKRHGIEVKELKPLTSRLLMHYLREERRISLPIARHFLKEVHYSMNGREYFALGFPNRSGGWELRNAFFKASSSPKDVSFIRANSNVSNGLLVFEGFLDYLSILTQMNQKDPGRDVIVLNSLALQERAIGLIQEQSYNEIHTYFDNDHAGKQATNRFGQLPGKVLPKNYLYAEYKDVNDHHQHTYERFWQR